MKCYVKHLTVLQSLFQIVFQYGIDPNVTVRAKIGMDQSEFEFKTQKSVKCHAAPLTALESLFQIVFQHRIDPNVTAMMDKVDLAILPVLNVDGYAYTWTKVRFIFHPIKFHHHLPSKILRRFLTNFTSRMY